MDTVICSLVRGFSFVLYYCADFAVIQIEKNRQLSTLMEYRHVDTI